MNIKRTNNNLAILYYGDFLKSIQTPRHQYHSAIMVLFHKIVNKRDNNCIHITH